MLAAFVLINSTAMGNRGRLIAPGGLRDELAAVAEDAPAAGESLAEMAAQYGLRPSSARPRLVSYLVKVWQRRHFILAYATARNVSMYTEARLGQLWQVLTPLLNSAVYYLIFGILFKANRGISRYYTAYLVTGVFIFAFTERSIVVGSTVIRSNITLIRALHFPRACLPLAYVLVEFQQLLLSMVVLFAAAVGQERALLQPGGRVHLADQVCGHVLVPGRRARRQALRRDAVRDLHREEDSVDAGLLPPGHRHQ